MSEEFFDLLIWVVLAGGVGAASWFGSFRNLVKARTIEDTPTSKIRSAHQGYVELEGTGTEYLDGPVIAPLTQTPCIWYRYLIEKHESSGKRSRWRTVEKKSSGTPFTLEDGTGTCYIHPDRAEVTTDIRKTWYGNSRYPTSTESAGLFSRRYRYTEWRIASGTPLYCIGRFETTHPPSIQEQTKQRMGDVVNEWKQNYDQLVERFDRNGDGEIDLQEWEHVRNRAELDAYRQVRENYDHTPINMLSYSPDRRQPYLISTSDPARLATRYRWRFFGYGTLAVGCTVAFFVLLPLAIQAW